MNKFFAKIVDGVMIALVFVALVAVLVWAASQDSGAPQPVQGTERGTQCHLHRTRC